MKAYELWKYLHDGCIERIDGTVPGEVTVVVSIHYVRERFPGEGTGFNITLGGCTRFEYEPYDEPPCRNLGEIAQSEPEILSLKSVSPVIVCCVRGILRLEYASASVFLDSGEWISVEALAKAVAGYWEQWRHGCKTT
jgi:hypothetical protein